MKVNIRTFEVHLIEDIRKEVRIRISLSTGGHCEVEASVLLDQSVRMATNDGVSHSEDGSQPIASNCRTQATVNPQSQLAVTLGIHVSSVEGQGGGVSIHCDLGPEGWNVRVEGHERSVPQLPCEPAVTNADMSTLDSVPSVGDFTFDLNVLYPPGLETEVEEPSSSVHAQFWTEDAVRKCLGLLVASAIVVFHLFAFSQGLGDGFSFEDLLNLSLVDPFTAYKWIASSGKKKSRES